MQTAFKFGLDKIDSLNYPNFTPTEIDLLLNQGQDRFVKQRYGINNVKRESFEETQKRTEDLKTIVLNAIISPASNASDNIDTNAQFATLPTNHWFIVEERIEVMYQDCNLQGVKETVPVYPIQHYEFNKFMQNPFKRPNKERVLRLMENGKVELIHSSDVTLGNYKLRYIKRPDRINNISNPNVNCELPEHTHQEVVDLAIQIALEGIEAKRTGSFDKIVQTNE